MDTYSQVISPRPIKAEIKRMYSDNLNFCLSTSRRVYILNPTRTYAAIKRIHSEICQMREKTLAMLEMY